MDDKVFVQHQQISPILSFFKGTNALPLIPQTLQDIRVLKNELQFVLTSTRPRMV